MDLEDYKHILRVNLGTLCLNLRSKTENHGSWAETFGEWHGLDLSLRKHSG